MFNMLTLTRGERESDHHHHHGMVIIYHTCMHFADLLFIKKEEEWMEIGDDETEKKNERKICYKIYSLGCMI